MSSNRVIDCPAHRWKLKMKDNRICVFAGSGPGSFSGYEAILDSIETQNISAENVTLENMSIVT